MLNKGIFFSLKCLCAVIVLIELVHSSDSNELLEKVHVLTKRLDDIGADLTNSRKSCQEEKQQAGRIKEELESQLTELQNKEKELIKDNDRLENELSHFLKLDSNKTIETLKEDVNKCKLEVENINRTTTARISECQNEGKILRENEQNTIKSLELAKKQKKQLETKVIKLEEAQQELKKQLETLIKEKTSSKKLFEETTNKWTQKIEQCQAQLIANLDNSFLVSVKQFKHKLYGLYTIISAWFKLIKHKIESFSETSPALLSDIEKYKNELMIHVRILYAQIEKPLTHVQTISSPYTASIKEWYNVYVCPSVITTFNHIKNSQAFYQTKNFVSIFMQTALQKMYLTLHQHIVTPIVQIKPETAEFFPAAPIDLILTIALISCIIVFLIVFTLNFLFEIIKFCYKFSKIVLLSPFRFVQTYCLRKKKSEKTISENKKPQTNLSRHGQIKSSPNIDTPKEDNKKKKKN